MRNERNSLRQAAITAGILAALGVCTLGGDQPRVWAAESSNNTAQAEAKTAAVQGVQAAADETDGDGMDFTLEGVTVEAKRPDWEAKLSPGTVTVIRPDDYKGEQKDLPDLLKMVPGVHVREVNGKGQYTTVSVRGSTAAQVGVFVDGVLFNLGGDAAADISTIPVHNVERIEVYRGYIPARFGGTFMGGVINIVTKRPTKANVQASFGKSSFGGYKGSLQIDAPLGGGALMVGINRDQSEGDFKYKNFDNDRTYKERLQYYYKDLENTTNRINKQISYDVGFGMEEPSLGKVTSIDEMVTRCAPGGDIYEVFWKQNPDDYGGRDVMEHDWEFYYAKYADPNYKENLYKSDQYQLDKLESAERWRKANDYKNTDAIIKWQDDHWLAKATWKNIRRHLPHPIDNNYAPLWTVDQDWAVNMPYGKPNMYYFRNQELTAKELLLGRRDTVGNLEWGWSINYLKQDKDY